MYTIQLYNPFDCLLIKDNQTDYYEDAKEIYFGYYNRLSNNKTYLKVILLV